MTGTTDHADFSDSLGNPFFLGRQRKTIVVVDMVESVRLIAQDEASVVTRWKQFTQRVRSETLPPLGGMLVKSLGDGMMLTFPDARQAVSAARQMRLVMDQVNRETLTANPQAEQIILRTGIHSGEVVSDDIDIYGHSANLTARITSLGGPGEIIVSADVRDHLTDGLDGELEDLGECYLKHVEEPVRVYRVGGAGVETLLPDRKAYDVPLQPKLAVIPFVARSADPEHFAVGELIADGVISLVGRSRGLKVVSRLSATAFRGRNASLDDIVSHLGVSYVLSGSYLVIGKAGGGRLVVMSELVDTRSNEIVWTDRSHCDVNDLLELDSELIHRIAFAVQRSVLHIEGSRAVTKPLPTLASYTLMLSGISLMHSSTLNDFALSRKILRALTERHQRSAEVLAWTATWHLLKVTRGLTEDRDKDSSLAIELTRRALDIEPENSLALAVEGFVYCHMLRDMQGAKARLAVACEKNPNETLAWLFSGVVDAFLGNGLDSVQASERALSLSPIDPIRYYHESLAASSYFCARDFSSAVKLCEKSLKLNKLHIPTYRTLIAAHWHGGNHDAAKGNAKKLLQLNPDATVSKYLELSASSGLSFGKEIGQAMFDAGIPF